MPFPSVSDVQAVDPVLTNMMIGYAQGDARFIANRVFPVVPVEKDSGTYYILTKAYWFADDMKRRAPGTPYARGGFGVSTSTYTTAQWAIAYPVADEERSNSQLPMDLETVGVKWLAQQNLIRRERAFATAAFGTSIWGTDNTTAAKWNDYSNGDPVGNVMTAKRTISLGTGYDPNTLALGYQVHEGLVNHPDVIDRIKYTQAAGMASVESALASIFSVDNYLVSKAAYNSAVEGANASIAGIITTSALLCLVDPGAGVFGASAGKTFVWQPGGGDGVVLRNRDDLNDADILKCKAQFVQQTTATDLGYYFSAIVA
jgi:hypothetical protein